MSYFTKNVKSDFTKNVKCFIIFVGKASTMIKERLKELEIKITELANYLQISRPTMYKYIEEYDNGNKKEVNNSVCKLFDYIENNPLIGKRNVINYILTKMTNVKDVENNEINDIVGAVKEYVSNNPNSEKTQFIKKCVGQTQFDIAIHYLVEISPLLKKKKLSEEESKKLEAYKIIVKMYTQSN